jgi:hypothetical protein
VPQDYGASHGHGFYTRAGPIIGRRRSADTFKKIVTTGVRASSGKSDARCEFCARVIFWSGSLDSSGSWGSLTSYGKPFTSSASFGNWFADACREAGVGKTPHGLRKNCAIHWAEQGVTASQLCRIMVWSSIKEAEVDCRAAEGRKLAAMAARLPVE